MSTTPNILTLDILKAAITDGSSAIRTRITYEPAAGNGTKVFPPTYEGGKYALEGHDKEAGTASRVLLDSVQAQANRMELALLEAKRRDQLSLPVITTKIEGKGLLKQFSVSSLEAPHRIADALLRDSTLNGTKFRESEVGKSLDSVDLKNATPLLKHCPTALIFGLWDSTGPKGGLGVKFARALVSELVAHTVQLGVKTSSRIDPAEIVKDAAILYAAANGGWTLDEKEALKGEKGKPVILGKEGKPSEANHGNVTPSMFDKNKQPLPGGVIFEKAEQTVVLSLTALRRLCFPLTVGTTTDIATDDKARTLLAALGLCAAVLAAEQNSDLRSRCQLHATKPPEWEILTAGEPAKPYALTRQQALDLFKTALKEATEAGLPWHEEEVELHASPQLVELIRRSQTLAAKTTAEP